MDALSAPKLHEELPELWGELALAAGLLGLNRADQCEIANRAA